jgi:hypothetical protein
MIGQILPNNNESVTGIFFLKNFGSKQGLCSSFAPAWLHLLLQFELSFVFAAAFSA